MSGKQLAGHALVVGGTGMLRGVCLELAARGWVVSVLARRHSGLGLLAAEVRDLAAHEGMGGGSINPLPADYEDSGMLAARIRSARAAHGAISLALCWIHSTAPDAFDLVTELLSNPRRPCRVFRVVGSGYEPQPENEGRTQEPGHTEGVLVRRVVLGSVREGQGRRWLTHEEIARGVIGAIDRDEARCVIGDARW
jgi:hypothetical protein